MDSFLGRVKYNSFLGTEAFHVRSWQPMNIRAFLAAIEYHYQVPAYVKASGDPCLMGVLQGIVESYAGERGFLGTHRCKSNQPRGGLLSALGSEIHRRRGD
jgi:hypothetical protein